MEMAKLKKALGKKRMAQVEDIDVGRDHVDVQLKSGNGDIWDLNDFTESEIIFHIKRWIDEAA